jgi:hypothetical protein
VSERVVTIKLRPDEKGWYFSVEGFLSEDGIEKQELDVDCWTGKPGDYPSGPAGDALDIARLYLSRPWRGE